MSYSIEFSKRAQRNFETLPKAVQLQIQPIIFSLAQNPRPAGIKNIKELDKCYRLRHGDYRIVYTVRDKVLVVLILAVTDRKETYTRKEIAATQKELKCRM